MKEREERERSDSEPKRAEATPEGLKNNPGRTPGKAEGDETVDPPAEER